MLQVQAVPTSPQKGEVLTQGKTKKIYAVAGQPNRVIMKNLDDITAGDGARKESGTGKAALSTGITSAVFQYLNTYGVPTHFHEKLSDTEILAEKCDMIPLECVFRFVATGPYIKREQAQKGDNAIKDGTVLSTPVYELFYKNDVYVGDKKYSDPMIDIDEHGIPKIDTKGKLVLLDPKTGKTLNYDKMTDPSGREFKENEIQEQIENIQSSASDIRGMMLQISPILQRMYAQAGLDVYDGKVEFGRDSSGNILLSDVIDGDSCRVRSTILVEGTDGIIYLAKKENELDGADKEVLSAWMDENNPDARFEVIPDSILPVRYILDRGLDKPGFREGESIDTTLGKYQELDTRLAAVGQKNKGVIQNKPKDIARLAQKINFSENLDENFRMLMEQFGLEKEGNVGDIVKHIHIHMGGTIAEIKVGPGKYKTALFLKWLAGNGNKITLNDEKRELIRAYFGPAICSSLDNHPTVNLLLDTSTEVVMIG